TPMREAAERLQRVLHSLLTQVAVLDEGGIIVVTNDAWKRFSASLGPVETLAEGASYLEFLQREGGAAAAAVAQIVDVLRGRREAFDFEELAGQGAERVVTRVAPLRGSRGGAVSRFSATYRPKGELS
ncbi:MAG: hypothetical protein WCI05_12615, partial [Myxococcales bacterium]